MNILLKPSPKILTYRRKINTLKTKTQRRLALEHAMPLLWHELFTSSSTLRVLNETCNQESKEQRQLIWAYPRSCLQGFVCLTFQWGTSSPALAHFFLNNILGNQSRALPMLSPVASSTLGPFFVSLSPALINTQNHLDSCCEIFPTWRQELLASLRQTCSGPGPHAVTI